MLEKQKDIDAIVISTPDHTHAVIAAAAMESGKHVYLQKPLTHSVCESRYLTGLAKRKCVTTQMGNEGHSNDSVYEVAEVVQSGCLGAIHEVHVWTNRPIWRQGMPKPLVKVPIPKTLDWDLFIGPAPMRDYNKLLPLFRQLLFKDKLVSWHRPAGRCQETKRPPDRFPPAFYIPVPDGAFPCYKISYTPLFCDTIPNLDQTVRDRSFRI